jgi:hypothetical protein
VELPPAFKAPVAEDAMCVDERFLTPLLAGLRATSRGFLAVPLHILGPAAITPCEASGRAFGGHGAAFGAMTGQFVGADHFDSSVAVLSARNSDLYRRRRPRRPRSGV